jgi:protein disulfide isomerase
MADVVSGKLNPVLKSEEPAAQNDGPVKVVVGKNYKEMVADSGKDVMVEFYAPWCGHCKALEPEFNDLGKAFEKVDSVVIAKIDATANEIEDPEVQGFPTLYFYKAGSKEPVKYTGGRTAKEMEKYIRDNVGTPIGAKHDKEL